MTGPVSGEPVRGGSAARAGMRDDVGSILILLALGFTFRVIIAYLLPGSGFANDIGAFQFWAGDLAKNGLFGFYDRDFFHDYTPGYLYVLWIVGLVGQVFGGVGDLIKVPPMLADLGLAYLVWTMTRELGGSQRAGRVGALIVVINPITWFDSVVWAQVDSVGLIFLLLGLRELWRDRPERSAVFTVIGALVKPQLGILIPIVAAVTIRRALRPGGAYGRESAPVRRGSTSDWEVRTQGWVRIISTGVAGLATAFALSLPFGLSLPGLVEQIFKTAGGYPYLSVNAWNPWALITFDGSGIAANSAWVCDMVAPTCGRAFAVGAIPAVVVGTALTLLAFAVTSILVARRPDRQTILVGVVVLALVFFVVPTRVHERYLFPLVALGAILAAVSWRWRVAYLLSGLATIANMYFVLTTLYPNNPSIDDWLGTGRALGSFPVVALAAITQAGVLVFAFLQLRASAAARLAEEVTTSGRAVVQDDGVDARSHAPAPATAAAHDSTPAPETPPAAADEPMPAALAAAPGSGMVPDQAWREPEITSDARSGRRPAEPGSPPYPVWEDRPSSAELGLFGWLRHRLGERPIRRDRSRELHAESGGRIDRLDFWMMAVLAVSLLTVRMWRLGEPYQMIFDEVYHPRTAVEFLQYWRYGISHDIYEWTHPHLAKYAMAGGIVAWGNDRTTATSELGVPVLAAAVEPRWDENATASRITGNRLWVATGDAVRAYDLATRALVVEVSVPGAQALAIDRTTHRVLIGTVSGDIRTLTTTGLDGSRGPVPPGALNVTTFASLDRQIEFLQVTPDGATVVAVVAASTDSVSAPETTMNTAVVLDAASAVEVGRAAVGRVSAIAEAGTGSVALATPAGVAFLDTASAKVPTTIPLAGPPSGMAFTTDLDKDRLYVSYQADDGPRVATVNAPGSGGTPSLDTTFKLPGAAAGWVGYDLATQMVHVLGSRPDTGQPTVYVIEPHSRAVYADAALPFAPTALILDANQRYPSSDREQLLAFSAAGSTASVDVGQHAYAWRLPGVLAGVAMAVLLYLLARLLFRRREVAIFLAFIVAVDGMLFAQSRIGMNDAYVGLGIVAAYLLFASIWRSGGSRRRWLAFWLVMPLIGVALGFALASKWVAVYAIGALGVLVLARSALGRLLLIGGLVLATTVLGYLALSVPAGQGGGNFLFISLMIGLTLVAATANVLHPIAWTDEEERLLVWGPAVLGLIVLGGAIALGVAGRRVVLGPIAVSAQEVAFALIAASAAAFTIVALIGRWGFGPRAAAPGPEDPARFLPAPAPAPEGWLRPGASFGLPMLWTLVSLVAIPVALYVVSYIPWALVEDHRILTNWPPGNQGQTLWDLTQQMYRYHNNLSSPHAASSPWWAWAFDFKPVWFYQKGFAGGTAAAVYDAGNLVAWWLGIPAMAFAAWQAFVRRSPALALVAVAFAFQWLAWSRIDRAAFQYHYYTSLPFLFLALAYFLAELWHGASRRTWLLVRLAGAVAVIAPTTLWLFHRPLCAFVGVERVNPGSQACPTLIPDFLLSGRAAAIAIVVGVGVLILVRLLLSLANEASEDDTPLRTRMRNAVLAAIGISLGFVAASAFLDDTPIVKSTNIPVEPIALIVTIALLPLAAFVATARDARRFVAGLLVAMAGWFVLWYPNIAALPLPAALSNAYQGILPTYVYPFQFPVSTVDRSGPGPSLFGFQPALLLLALAAVVVIVGYAAWVWRVALADETLVDRVETNELQAGPGETGVPPSIREGVAVTGRTGQQDGHAGDGGPRPPDGGS
ncbi:MAG: phospholipid carrier-dependent glycosyltransferase [Chloroflexota bacterium]